MTLRLLLINFQKIFLRYCFIRKKVLILHPFYSYEKQMLNKQHNLLLIKWIH